MYYSLYDTREKEYMSFANEQPARKTVLWFFTAISDGVLDDYEYNSMKDDTSRMIDYLEEDGYEIHQHERRIREDEMYATMEPLPGAEVITTSKVKKELV